MLSLPSTSNDSCEICGQKSVGNNFGAQSCRACAAFFRRNALSSRTAYCSSGRCKPTAKGKFPCRKCRLDKCLKAGMDPKKFQLERDILRTASNFQSTKKQFYEIGLPQSMANFLGRPTSILSCEPDKASHVKMIINVSPMLSKVEHVLRQTSTIPYSMEMNSLEFLTLGLRNMRDQFEKTNLTAVTRIDKEATCQMWEMSIVHTATWFTSFREFRELPMAIQMTIVKSCWLLWSKLEPLAQTARYMKRCGVTGTDSVCANGHRVDYRDLEWDISWMTNYDKEQMMAMMPIEVDNNFGTIVKWLMELDASETELNYMLCQICLFMAAKRHPHIAPITERLLEIQADNLHAYYQKTLEGPSYATRIAKMMKINNLLVRDAWLRNERNRVIDVLNLLCFEFSDDEMFVGH